MVEMVYFKFKCPQCNGHIEADDSFCGQTVACPHCNKGIVVPRNANNIPTNQVASQPVHPTRTPQAVGAPEHVYVAKQNNFIPRIEPYSTYPNRNDNNCRMAIKCSRCGSEIELPNWVQEGQAIVCPYCDYKFKWESIFL